MIPVTIDLTQCHLIGLSDSDDHPLQVIFRFVLIHITCPFAPFLDDGLHAVATFQLEPKELQKKKQVE